MENSDFFSFTDNILNEWTGKNHHYDSAERYVEQYPERNVIIDIFPERILDPDKYCEVSVFYRKWVDGDIDKRTFLKHEKKYLNFIKTLWLYNSVDICYDVYYNKYFKKGGRKYRLFTKKTPITGIQYNVKQWNAIDEVLILALREAGFLWMYFNEWEILAIVHDFCIQLLFKDAKTIQRIHPLVDKNALYMQTVTKSGCSKLEL